MNMFDARLDQKYARVRVSEYDYDYDCTNITVTLETGELCFNFKSSDGYAESKESLIHLLNEAGYKVIFL